MNVLSMKVKTEMLRALCEGCSIRSIERLTGHHRDTIMRVLNSAGKQAKMVMNAYMKDIKAESLQVDEIWTFVGKKDSQLTIEEKTVGLFGSQFIFVAIDAKTKLIPLFMMGQRSFDMTYKFMKELRRRITGYTFITTDGMPAYDSAVGMAFRGMASHAQLVKVYMHNGHPSVEGYSPVDFVLTKPRVMLGSFYGRRVSTSFVERQNLTMRMSMRRLTRLTNGFSKKFDNLMDALYLHFAFYNFGRIHSSLRITPAMKAGITDHIWSMEEILSFAA
ncbi:MAG: DDE-type integrase/transposase/recombinase [Sedimentisphaerales bacterium]|nr:DDE-type integrase/transposase/recombinase [Sedimentisphaerales bacterium]